jgi:LysR family transcriptional regulator, carnitine catabolism transcriptional activator
MSPGVRASAGYRASALDVRRLSLFLAVVEHGGFTRAAQAVHISQPALSQAIAELEAELRGPLFHRLGGKVTLTDAGTALVGPARSVLREIDAARQVTAEVNKLGRGYLDLSSLPTLSTDPLPALLGAFRRAHPAVTVRMVSPGDPDELTEQVRSGAAEVGITDARRAADGLVASPLCGQQLVAVFPPGSVRPDRPLRPPDLADVPLIVTPPGSSGRGLLDAALGRKGIRPVVAIETGQREAILPLVLAGAGAAVMPEALAALAAAQGAVPVPFDPPLTRDLVVVRRPGPPTPPAAAFLAVTAGLAARRLAPGEPGAASGP